jgi:murein DD-endopeptidase MepM/ murein hydrolase activator NlpD
VVSVGNFLWPCPGYATVSSGFGPRPSPTPGASSNHQGIDIAAPAGANIIAVAAGTISFAGYSSSAGNYILLSHGNGLYTVYMHCSSLVVTSGSVSAGQVIAKVGSTGVSTGNHLHFGVSLNGVYVNPWNYL